MRWFRINFLFYDCASDCVFDVLILAFTNRIVFVSRKWKGISINREPKKNSGYIQCREYFFLYVYLRRRWKFYGIYSDTSSRVYSYTTYTHMKRQYKRKDTISKFNRKMYSTLYFFENFWNTMLTKESTPRKQIKGLDFGFNLQLDLQWPW